MSQEKVYNVINIIKMVSVKTENGKIVITNSIPIVDDVAEKIEAVVKTEKKVVASIMKDLNIDHWIETNGNKKMTVASRKFSNESEIDVIEEIKSLRATQQRFVEALMGMKCDKKQDSQPEETADVTDNEEEEFLKYAFLCKLQEMIDSCAAIIIAIPK